MPESISQLSPAGQAWERATSRWLDALAIAFLVDLILLWSLPEASAGATFIFESVIWIVWAGFAVDYFVRMLSSHPRRSFVASHKLDLLMVLVPMLRILRVFLLLRKTLTSVSTDKIAGSIASLVVVVVLVSAFAEWQVERDATGATITTFRTALWWAVVTTTTVGYGDYTPVTQIGRLIAMGVMVVGIGLIGTISATVAAWFVNRPSSARQARTEPTGPPAALEPDSSALLARLDLLTMQKEEIRQLLLRRDQAP